MNGARQDSKGIWWGDVENLIKFFLSVFLCGKKEQLKDFATHLWEGNLYI